MSTHLTTLAVGAAVVAGLAVAPALDARDYLSMSHGSMIGEGMIDQGGMMRNMMRMSGGMGDMAGMMEHCNETMQGMDGGHAHRPNEQWRPGEHAPQEDLPAAARRQRVTLPQPRKHRIPMVLKRGSSAFVDAVERTGWVRAR